MSDIQIKTMVAAALTYPDRDNVNLNNTQVVFDHLYSLSNKNAMLLFMNDNFK